MVFIQKLTNHRTYHSTIRRKYIPADKFRDFGQANFVIQFKGVVVWDQCVASRIFQSRNVFPDPEQVLLNAGDKFVALSSHWQRVHEAAFHSYKTK